MFIKRVMLWVARTIVPKFSLILMIYHDIITKYLKVDTIINLGDLLYGFLGFYRLTPLVPAGSLVWSWCLATCLRDCTDLHLFPKQCSCPGGQPGVAVWLLAEDTAVQMHLQLSAEELFWFPQWPLLPVDKMFEIIYQLLCEYKC